VEPSLVVIGLNFRTAPVAVRERFWISESRRYDALHQLIRSDGIEEAVVLTTCNRTEFIVWASDASEAANSVLRFLTREYDLKLCEWSNFYRLIDEAALLHVFRVASSLDSLVVGETEIVEQVTAAWETAQKAGTTGRFLDSVMQKSLSVSKRVRTETAIGVSPFSVSRAAVDLSRKVLGSIGGRNVVLLGAGKMSEQAAQELMSEGAKSLSVVNRTFEHATQLAEKLGGLPFSFENRHEHLKDADIIVSSTSSPHYIFTRHDAETIMQGREERSLAIIDIAMPRDVDPQVRGVRNCFVHDMDDLERAIPRKMGDAHLAEVEAGKIVEAEAHDLRNKLAGEHAVPSVVALRSHLEEICRQELQQMSEEYGPFTEDESRALATLGAHITRRIAGSLARELKELPETTKQQDLTIALEKLFNLQMGRALEASSKD
jgi:glutamyl-tRNA reductase